MFTSKNNKQNLNDKRASEEVVEELIFFVMAHSGFAHIGLCAINSWAPRKIFVSSFSFTAIKGILFFVSSVPRICFCWILRGSIEKQIGSFFVSNWVFTYWSFKAQNIDANESLSCTKAYKSDKDQFENNYSVNKILNVKLRYLKAVKLTSA